MEPFVFLSYQSSRKPWDLQKSYKVLEWKDQQWQAVTLLVQVIIRDVFHRMTPWGYVINIDKKCKLVDILLNTTKL